MLAKLPLIYVDKTLFSALGEPWNMAQRTETISPNETYAISAAFDVLDEKRTFAAAFAGVYFADDADWWQLTFRRFESCSLRGFPSTQ